MCGVGWALLGTAPLRVGTKFHRLRFIAPQAEGRGTHREVNLGSLAGVFVCTCAVWWVYGLHPRVEFQPGL